MTVASRQIDLCMSVAVPASLSSNPFLSTKSPLVTQKHKRCRSQIKARTRIRRLKR